MLVVWRSCCSMLSLVQTKNWRVTACLQTVFAQRNPALLASKQWHSTPKLQ